MYSLLTVAIVALCSALVLTPICRNLAIRWEMLDRPDKIRKLHARPIPQVGGIPIIGAYITAFAILFLLPFQWSNILRSHLDLAWKLLPAAALVFLTGLLDDWFGLKPWQKLLGQLAAASTAFAAGCQFTGVAGHHFGLWWTLPITILWLIGCTNAFNLIDGVDGLAAGVGFLATVTTLVAALLQHNVGLALATAPLAGALLGFLRYNFNPATIFLGDSGSLLVGFLLGCYSLLWSSKSATALGMTAPIMVLAIPLLDTSLSILRRFLRHKAIFGADRGHIHHKLLARGLTPRRVAIVIYIVCGLAACLSLLQSVFHAQFGGVITVVFCGAVWIGIRHLGYAEFDMARRMVFTGTYRRLLDAQLRLITFRQDLAAAATPDQTWQVLQDAYSDFGFNEIKFKLDDRLYSHTTDGHHIPNSWTIQIALSNTDYVNLSREFDAEEAPPLIAPFADTIGKVLQYKTGGVLYQRAALASSIDSRPGALRDWTDDVVGTSDVSCVN